jgi:hypothetical protein
MFMAMSSDCASHMLCTVYCLLIHQSSTFKRAYNLFRHIRGRTPGFSKQECDLNSSKKKFELRKELLSARSSRSRAKNEAALPEIDSNDHPERDKLGC